MVTNSIGSFGSSSISENNKQSSITRAFTHSLARSLARSFVNSIESNAMDGWMCVSLTASSIRFSRRRHCRAKPMPMPIITRRRRLMPGRLPGCLVVIVVVVVVSMMTINH